jgi:hypothetical protein
MYPNPVKSNLTIEANSTIERVSVYNILGQSFERKAKRILQHYKLITCILLKRNGKCQLQNHERISLIEFEERIGNPMRFFF